jgi:hypothetical protein
MPEVCNTTAISPSGGAYLISVKDFDASGKSTALECEMPTTGDFEKWSLTQQIVMLKRGMWKASSVADIIWGLAYAHRLNADVMRGELFPTGEGRWGTSNKYKIKQALATGRVQGITVEIRDTGEKCELSGCVQKTDLECTVTIKVKDWAEPIVRKARLSRWYKAANPNWKGNPEHMLELNTVAHALEYVEPIATEDDEAPPLAGVGA